MIRGAVPGRQLHAVAILGAVPETGVLIGEQH